SPRIPSQSFAELPFEEEILEFLRHLGHSDEIRHLTDFQIISSINSMGILSQKQRDSASSTTPPTPTPTTTVVAAPRLSVTAKGKQPARATTPTEPTDVKRTEAEQLKIVLKRSRQETHISQQRGSSTDEGIEGHYTTPAKGKQPASATSPTGPSDVERTEAEHLKIVLRRSRHETHISLQGGSSTDEGTGSIPGVLDVPSDDSEEEISWNSSDDEDVDDHTKGSDDKEGEKTDESDDDDDDQEETEKVNDDDDDEEEISKIGEQEATESDEGDDEATESDGESEDEETREQEEESFDLIPRIPEDGEDYGNNEEDQGLRISEEERMHEEEEADELYHDVDINQGRGLQVSQETKDSHVILTPTHSDSQQESSSTSSFVTNLLNLTIDPASQLPIPPTPIPSLDLQNLLTFALVFHFEDRMKSLEVNFSNIP
nr:hypothetical protein [Tanacetum cinerariifolium]